jgi:hypothetical protein
MLAMAKRRTKRKRKVLTVKFDDMQRTNNVDAAVRSFEGPTKATLAIASEIADYSKRSFDHNIKMMENLLNARSLDKAIEVQRLCQPDDQVGPTLHRLGQGGLQVVPGFSRKGDASI